MSAAEIIAELPHLSSGELALVRDKLRELVESHPDAAQTQSAIGHPAVGIWKDRTDLPDDSVEASNILRERMMRRTEGS